MAVVTCELCERSEEPNSQSTYGFQIKSRSIRGVKRNICESCRSHIYRNKIDFVTAKKNRVKNHHRLLKSKKYVGLCECCNRDGIEVQKRSFHSGLFMKTVCTPCRDFIYKSELKDFSELRNQRIWKSKTIDRYRNSIYKIIPKHDRIIVQKDGIKNNQKYIIRLNG